MQITAAGHDYCIGAEFVIRIDRAWIFNQFNIHNQTYLYDGAMVYLLPQKY